MKKNSFCSVAIWILIGINTIINVFCLCHLYSRNQNLSLDYMGIIVGVLSLLVTTLVGFQLVQYIRYENLRNKFTEQLNFTLKTSIQDNNHTISALIRHVYATFYLGHKDKDLNLALENLIAAIEELNCATNKEPLNGIIEEIIAIANDKTFSITQSEKNRYINACAKLEQSEKLLNSINDIPTTTQNNVVGDNIQGGNVNVKK